MRDPDRPKLNEFLARAMQDLDAAERGLPPELVRPARGLYAPRGIRSYMSETSDDYKAFITPEDVGLPRTTEAETIALAAALPCDWVIRRASVLLRSLERPGKLDSDPQPALAGEWAPADVKDRVLKLVSEGSFLVNSEQLLAAMRLAIEHGTDRPQLPPGEISASFGRLLLSINDRLTDEGPPENATSEQLTAFGLRAMGFATSQVLWHIIGRAEAMWFAITPALSKSKKYQPVADEFKRVTGADLAAYNAVITAIFAHTENAFTNGDWSSWAIWPQTFFSKAKDPVMMRAAQDLLVASRNWYRGQFTAWQSPKYVGVAAMPLRKRPLYQMQDGSVVVLSGRFLVESQLSGVFWLIADSIKDDAKRRQFTDFIGEVHERYVYELCRSCVDEMRTPAFVFSDEDARPSKSGADTVIVSPGLGVFLETTSTELRFLRTVVPADLAAFDADVKSKIVNKVFQVERAIDRYRMGKVAYPWKDQRRWNMTAWPVVVLREPLPTFFLLDRRVRSLIAQEKPKDDFARSPVPVCLLSTEDLELALEPRDPDRLRHLLVEWRQDDAYREESFRNFYLHRHHADDINPPPYLAAKYHSAFARVAQLLGFAIGQSPFES